MTVTTLGARRRAAAGRLRVGLDLKASLAWLEAGILAKMVLPDCDDAEMLLRETSELPAEQGRAYDDLVAQRVRGTPIAHLAGTREFYGLAIHCAPGALIPRPESELLIDALRARRPASSALSLADLGTGTGALALALAHCFRQAQIIAVECDPAALALARVNFAGPWAARIELRAGSWDRIAGTSLDAVLANPPYLTSSETTRLLGDGSLRDPRIALDGGPDGLTRIRELLPQARSALKPGGLMLLEHGASQRHAASRLMRHYGFGGIEGLRDLAGHDRVLVGRRPSSVGLNA